ncbi:helix-turn-helix transcriptional regulator [Acetobacteraceae bacterium KSS8]|uniref:Helix-turn-helix transcriptional regulator n=1 Tax=Endosaccharibacter trunci TaxID=2812733 RepID=A0ABT1W1Z5_9PROT|nr:helix-turn-helix transcriptional regulator [Acetobacteraceae bacterium KSS8]
MPTRTLGDGPSLMRLNEIGQQLRAYRLETGMRADEIAAKLGVSRAALYRYEKGEVIKLDTVQRLGDLLNISPLSLLGVGVEYYTRTIGFFERLRQIEENADQILQLGPSFCQLVASDAFDSVRTDAMLELVEQDRDPKAARALCDQVLEIQAARRRSYRERRPGIVAILPEQGIRHLLENGVCPALPLRPETRARCREVARIEIEAVAEVLETEPMGLQFSLMPGVSVPPGCFVMRQRDRASLAINPFNSDVHFDEPGGVAMVTSAPEAVTVHQKMAETSWRESLKGAAAARKLRDLLAEHAAG